MVRSIWYRYNSLIIEYSSFIVFLSYCIGIFGFILDLLLGYYHSSTKLILIGSNFTTKNCALKFNDDSNGIKLSGAMIEWWIVFGIYFLIFSWMGFYEWMRTSHWEYMIDVDPHDHFSDLCHYVFQNYPNYPDYSIETDSDLELHQCRHKSILPSRHWLFMKELKNSPISEFPRLFMLWFCSLILICILLFANCFSKGRISFSNYEEVAIFYMVYNLMLSIIIWLVTIGTTLMAFLITRYYSNLENKILVHLTAERGLDSETVKSFLKDIGKDGLAMVVKMSEVMDKQHSMYLLMLMVCEYCRVHRVPITFDKTWDNFDYSDSETSHEETYEIPNKTAALKSPTYEHYDSLDIDLEMN